jgi:hypothetical protein
MAAFESSALLPMPVIAANSSSEHGQGTMREVQSAASGRRGACVLRWTEILFLILGVAALAWSALLLGVRRSLSESPVGRLRVRRGLKPGQTPP